MMAPEKAAALQDAAHGARIVSRLLCAGVDLDAIARDDATAKDDERTARQDLFAALRTCCVAIFDMAERAEARQEGQPKQQRETPSVRTALAYTYWHGMQDMLRHVERGILQAGSDASIADMAYLRRYLKSLRDMVAKGPREGSDGSQESA